MIRLTKGAQPAVLQRNATRWLEDLLQAIQLGDERLVRNTTRRYNHPEIKGALKQETYKKCAYCESFVPHVAHGDIEHVTPKSLQRELTFEWTNLTFACQICNQLKSTTDDVVDPYNVDPINHIFFFGHIARGRSRSGLKTISSVSINRPELIEHRQRALTRFSAMFERVILETDDLCQDALIQEIEHLILVDEYPYVSMLRCAWNAYRRVIRD